MTMLQNAADDPRVELERRVQRDEHRADRAGHQVEVEPHRVRGQPPEQLDAPEDRIDRGDDHEADADQRRSRSTGRSPARYVDRLEDRRVGQVRVLGARLEQAVLVRHRRRVEAQQGLAEQHQEREQADQPQEQRRVAAALDLREAARAHVDALGERQDGQDFLAVALRSDRRRSRGARAAPSPASARGTGRTR